MEYHPSREKLELFIHGKIGGAESLEILQHTENCDYCFQNLPSEDPQEFIQRLLSNDEVFEESKDRQFEYED